MRLRFLGVAMVIAHREWSAQAGEPGEESVVRVDGDSARRAGAARVSRDLAGESDLVTLLGVTEHGMSVLFGGVCTVQLGMSPVDGPTGASEWLAAETLSPEANLGFTTVAPADDDPHPRAGVLLSPHSAVGTCRAWVQFTEPRRVELDELIVADLFAQAFAIAVDRIISLDLATKREVQLQQAVEGHRLIGQATGVLMERHRITPAAAFGRLRAASQNRNLKLREIAERVVDTGLEPDIA